MANTTDTLLVTGPVNQQVSADAILVTPSGGTQTTLASVLNGGTVANSGTFSSAVIGSNTLTAIANFASITPAGSNQATATAINAQTVQLGTAAATTGVVFPSAAGAVPGEYMLIINSGSAAIHLYGNGANVIDTIAGSTGVTLTNGFSCFFTPTSGTSWVSGPRGAISS